MGKTRLDFGQYRGPSRRVNRGFIAGCFLASRSGKTQKFFSSPLLSSTMKAKFSSAFKSPSDDRAWFSNWVTQLENSNDRQYEKKEVHTEIGRAACRERAECA